MTDDERKMADHREWAGRVLESLPPYPGDDATDADFRDYDEARADTGEAAVDLLCSLFPEFDIRTTPSGARAESESDPVADRMESDGITEDEAIARLRAESEGR